EAARPQRAAFPRDLTVARVAVAHLELLAGAARAGGVPADVRELAVAGLNGGVLSAAGGVVARRAVAEVARALRPREACRDGAVAATRRGLLSRAGRLGSPRLLPLAVPARPLSLLRGLGLLARLRPSRC